ncbi:Molybdenum ABC transporter ATP-binding protein ModC, partial [hydrothermal vent metagenome]
MNGLYAHFKLSKQGFTLDAKLSAPDSGVTALFGPSGAGKTIFLRCVAGLDIPDEGFLKVNGDTWLDKASGFSLATYERPVGYVFQDSRLFPHLSVMNNLKYGYSRTPENKRQIKLEHVIEWLSLGSLLQRNPLRLSGGEKQRVAIGRALLTSPRLLLMDEPLASLDEESKLEIYPYLEKLHKDLSIPVIYVTHSYNEVTRLADYLALIKDGSIYAAGPIREMATNLNVPVAFRQDAGSVIETRVTEHDDEFSLTYLNFPGGRITVAKNDHPVGASVRVRIIASDVSISTIKPEKSSVLNVFEGSVLELATASASHKMVKLDLNGTHLLARITRKSEKNLSLVP